MDSTKPFLSAALADERVGAGWRRPRKAARIVAAVSAVLAAAAVFALFNQFGIFKSDDGPQRQLIASVDLRIGTPALASERGAAKARADIEAGHLQLEVFGAPWPAAKAQRLKQRFGIVAVSKGKEATPLTQAHADAYNQVMQAELERRHGREALEQLLRELDLGAVKQDIKKDAP
jgi:hypothetical protein